MLNLLNGGLFHYKMPFISNNEFCLRIYFIQYLYNHLWSDLLTEYICAFEFSIICTFHFHALEKEMATHSSVLAWRIPRTEKPGRPRGHKELDTTERLHFTSLHTNVSSQHGAYLKITVIFLMYFN